MPAKALYRLFEEHPDLENDHFLCEKLGWRSVEEMRRKMSAREYGAWMVFYGRRSQEAEMARGAEG